jgi:two-component system cell cycle response regulator
MARILLIEDNPTNLELISYLLGAFGHEVTTAADGRAGLEQARRLDPALIICDIQMPELSGYEVARQLKSSPALAAIPLVAVTALAMVDDRRKVLNGGFDGYITKPIQPETFIDQLAPFLPAPLRRAAASRPPEPATPGEPAAPAAQSAESPVILVVDNAADNARLARHLLEPTGYRVETAGNAEAALASLRGRAPSLILSDLHMPGGSGFDLLRAVKADPRTRAIPFVVLTASIWPERDREHAMQLGADRFIVRPISPDRLLGEIKAVLERPKR